MNRVRQSLCVSLVLSVSALATELIRPMARLRSSSLGRVTQWLDNILEDLAGHVIGMVTGGTA